MPVFPYLGGVEVHFTPEQETQLAKIASSAGTDPEALVKRAALRLLEDDARFIEAVLHGEAALERGDCLTHEHMGDRLKRFLQP
jgi:predicted transcriptional regulator